MFLPEQTQEAQLLGPRPENPEGTVQLMTSSSLDMDSRKETLLHHEAPTKDMLGMSD